MPFCPECGKNVGSSQKFCRSCGASLIEESSAAAAPVAPLSGGLSCRSCGTPLAPDEKFCGNCGARSGDVPPAPAPAVPAPAPVYPAPSPAPAPVFQAPAPVYQAPPPAYQPPPPPPQQYTAPVATAAVGLLCKACGNPIKPGDKFCSKCLVKVPDIPAAAPAAFQAPAPVYQAPPPAYQPPPPPPQQYTAPVATAAVGLLCKACGSPIKPGDKFCSKCLVKVPDIPAAAPAAFQAPAPVYQAPPPAYQPPPPPPQQYTAPVATAAVGLLCKACGNPIKPGDKFCSKCLVKVPDIPAAAPAAYPAPPPAYHPPTPLSAAVPGGYVCSSCGSPVSGSEKFCGICGATVVAARAPAPVPAPAASPAGKFCGSCGAAISNTIKFCGSCGAAVNAAPPGGGDASFRPAPTVAAGGEEVIGVIANARKVKMLSVSWDTWNIVVTSRRMIMVQMTAAMINAAVAEAQAKAKAEGKGFFGIMKDQLSAQFRYAVRYEAMNPDMALAETPGNLSVENARITAIKMKLRDTGSGEVEYTEFKMVIESADGKFEYMMAEDDRYVNLLKQVYGDKVHMPFGYFKVGATRVKFF
jgi:predicted amidophosphoribosyltransferase